MEVQLHAFLTLALDGGVFIFLILPLVQGEAASSTHWVGDLLGPSAGLCVVEKRKGKISAAVGCVTLNLRLPSLLSSHCTA